MPFYIMVTGKYWFVERWDGQKDAINRANDLTETFEPEVFRVIGSPDDIAAYTPEEQKAMFRALTENEDKEDDETRAQRLWNLLNNVLDFAPYLEQHAEYLALQKVKEDSVKSTTQSKSTKEKKTMTTKKKTAKKTPAKRVAGKKASKTATKKKAASKKRTAKKTSAKKTAAKKSGGAPQRNGSCQKVWEIAKSMGKSAARKDVLDACEKKGINRGTASTQYQKFRVAQGW